MSTSFKLMLLAALFTTPYALVAQQPESSRLDQHQGLLRIKPSESAAADHERKFRGKYDINNVGHRGIGSGINLYSRARELRLGNELSSQIDHKVSLLTDPALLNYLDGVVQRLAFSSDLPSKYIVKIIEDPSVNAFSLPGGYLYVTSGLLQFCENEAELAAVFSHEVAHVVARHGTRALTKSQLWTFASIPVLFVAGPTAAIVQGVTSTLIRISMFRLDRNAEFEADLLGIQYLYLAGYDPRVFDDVFERLLRYEKRPLLLTRPFANHPEIPSRISKSRVLIGELLKGRDTYVLDTSDFETFKLKLQWDFTHAQPKTTVDKHPRDDSQKSFWRWVGLGGFRSPHR